MNRLRAELYSRLKNRQLNSYAIPIAVITVSVIAVLIMLVVLTISVSQQVQTGQELLSINLNDQTRTFVQLQREALRMLVIASKPQSDFDVDSAQLQYELLASRVNHMNRAAVDEVVPPNVAENADQLDLMWKSLSLDIVDWIANPDEENIHRRVIDQLVDFELLANTTEIDFNRSRTFTLVEFANSSNQIPVMFGIVIVALLALVTAVLFGAYRYVQEIREAESARQASQLKDQFLAVMSHELRTPLNAIIGFLGIIKMGGNLPEKEAHMVDRSRANAERLLTLINDVLDISKIEAGRFEIVAEPVKLRELITRWTSQMDILASQKGVQFKVDIDDKLPEQINADVDALTKIVTNLLANAFKFTAEGSVSLKVDSGLDTLIISVADTGIGIPADKQEAIFESFQQVDGSTRRAYGGTGLGLSIVKKLTLLLNGQIEVKSQLDRGSTFIVTLPLEVTSKEKLTVETIEVKPAMIEEIGNAYSK